MFTLDRLRKVSADTRNPFLANDLEVIYITENRYSGIPTVYNFCKTLRARAEIEEHCKGSLSINYLMIKIISLLVENGKLKLIILDKPKSKNQRF